MEPRCVCRLADQMSIKISAAAAAAETLELAQSVKYALRLPTGALVPVSNPEDKLEIARKTATLGGRFGYYLKDFVGYNDNHSRVAVVRSDEPKVTRKPAKVQNGLDYFQKDFVG